MPSRGCAYPRLVWALALGSHLSRLIHRRQHHGGAHNHLFSSLISYFRRQYQPVFIFNKLYYIKFYR